MSRPVVAVVTMGGVAQAKDAVVLSHHASMTAAKMRAMKERGCQRDAIAEIAWDFVRAGGVIAASVPVRCLCGAVDPRTVDIGDGLPRCENCGCH